MQQTPRIQSDPKTGRTCWREWTLFLFLARCYSIFAWLTELMLLAMFKSGHWGIRIIPMMPSKRGSLGQRWWLLIGAWGLLWDPHRQLLEKEPHYKMSSWTVRRNHLPRCRSCMGFFEFQEETDLMSSQLLNSLGPRKSRLLSTRWPKTQWEVLKRLCASLWKPKKAWTKMLILEYSPEN